MTSIDLDLHSLDQSPSEPCHFMPCKIEYNGEAKISEFFTTTIKKGDCFSDIYTASFRGRPLNGQELKVPSGYKGIILHEPHQRRVDDERRRLVASSSFDKLMFWNLDRQPTEDDPFQRALQWIDISEAIHRPVSDVPSLSSQTSSQSSLKGN